MNSPMGLGEMIVPDHHKNMKSVAKIGMTAAVTA